MHPVIYDVAVSIDGYIAGPGDDVTRFAHDGPVVEDYRARLQTYRVALMGRKTYEFGYRYGLRPGENPYPWMRTLVVSDSLALPCNSDVEVIGGEIAEQVERLKSTADGPVYLCGGGQLAAKLARHGLIDRLRLKRAPILLQDGVRLCAHGAPEAGRLILKEQRDYGDGYLFQEFTVCPR